MTFSKADIAFVLSCLAFLQGLGLGPTALAIMAAFLFGRISR